MPHAVFPTGSITTTTRGVGRPLVPGIEPGGSRFGEPFKPALLIEKVTVEPVAIVPNASAGGEERALLALILSQESDLTPALFLPVASWVFETETAAGIITPRKEVIFTGQGTIWAPAFVGFHVTLAGTWSNFNARIHLDYEAVDIDWMDWFIRWDFLDNVVDADLEY